MYIGDLGKYFAPKTTPSTNTTNSITHSLSISANNLSDQHTIFQNPHSERPLSLIGCDINQAFEPQKHYNNIQDKPIDNLSNSLKKSSLFNKIIIFYNFIF